jgi:hypothetical protein
MTKIEKPWPWKNRKVGIDHFLVRFPTEPLFDLVIFIKEIVSFLALPRGTDCIFLFF